MNWFVGFLRGEEFIRTRQGCGGHMKSVQRRETRLESFVVGVSRNDFHRFGPA